MGKYYKIAALAVCSLMSFTGCNQTSVSSTQDDSDQEGAYYVAPEIWVGPGFYYGVWFNTELDFNRYHDHHYHRDHDRHRDRDRHRDHDLRRDDGHYRNRSDGQRHDGARSHRGGGGGGEDHHGPKGKK